MAETTLKIILEGAKTAEDELGKVSNSFKKVGDASQKTSTDSKKAFKETEKQLKDTGKFANNLKSQFIDLGKGILAAFAVHAIVDFAKEGIKAFAEEEAALRRLEFTLTKVNGETIESVKELNEQAVELSESLNTLFTPGDITNAQAMQAQYGLTARQIQELTPRVADLAAATGITLAQATDKAIAAINGQSKGLKDIGVSFEDTGSKTKNFNKLLEDTAKFSGSAADSLTTMEGAVNANVNKWEEFQESVGGFLIEAGDTALTFLNFFASGFDTAAEANQRLNKELKISAEQSKALSNALNKLSDVNFENLKKSGLDGLALQKAQQERAKQTEEEYSKFIRKLSDDDLKKELDNLNKGTEALGIKFINEKNLAIAQSEFEIRNKGIVDDLTIKGEAEIEAAIEKRRAEKEAADKKSLEDEKKFRNDLANLIFKSNSEVDQELIDSQKNLDQFKIDATKSTIDNITGLQKDALDAEKANNEARYQEELARLTKLEQEKFTVKGIFNDLGIELNDRQYVATQQFYANLLTLTKDNAQAQKVFATGEALVNTYLGASQALAAYPPPFSFIAAAVAVAAGLLNVAKINNVQFHDGGYTGDGGEWQPSGVVHKGEFVTTKEKTARHRGLLEAIHNDKAPNIADITSLLKGTGVVLMPETATRISNEMSASQNQKLYQQQVSDKNIEELNENFKKWMQSHGKNFDKTLPDGTRIIKVGNTIRKITKRKI